MYLHGMSSGDFAPALGEFFGSDAGLSASVITRLTTSWQDERERFSRRSLTEVDYVYVWVGRGPLQRPPRGGAFVLPGDGGGARGRDQGVGGHRGWLPGVDPVLGRPAQRLQA